MHLGILLGIEQVKYTSLEHTVRTALRKAITCSVYNLHCSAK